MRSGYVPLARSPRWATACSRACRSCECLCLDDVDAVAGRLAWERGLFGLLPRLRGAAAAAWCVPPQRRRRCCRGRCRIWARALPPAPCFSCAPSMRPSSARPAAAGARLRGLELPEETLRWLQRRFPRDMRTLYELLDTLDEAALVAQRRLTVPFIREVLGAPRRARAWSSWTASRATRRPSACASDFLLLGQGGAASLPADVRGAVGRAAAAGFVEGALGVGHADEVACRDAAAAASSTAASSPARRASSAWR